MTAIAPAVSADSLARAVTLVNGSAGPAGPDGSLETLRERARRVDDLYQQVMQEGIDYALMAEGAKPVLLRPGAELLCSAFGLAPTVVLDPASSHDWERGVFALIVRCRLTSRHSGQVVTEALGTCNSREGRYRWRSTRRQCPRCQTAAIVRGKPEFGGGWLCFRKLGGCGVHFEVNDAVIASQPVGRVENDDPYTLYPTLLKTAEQRALNAVVLYATGASRIFTQDIDESSYVFAMSPVAIGERGVEPTEELRSGDDGVDPDDLEAIARLSLPLRWPRLVALAERRAVEGWQAARAVDPQTTPLAQLRGYAEELARRIREDQEPSVA